MPNTLPFPYPAAAANLRQARRETSATETAEPAIGLRQNAFYQTGKSFEEVLRQRSKIEAVRQGVILGLELRQEIAEMRFDAYLVVLLLSLIKDFIDIPKLLVEVLSLGTIGTLLGVLINIVITIALFIVFLGRKSWLKRFLIRFFIWPIVVEFIPFISVFPTYTLATLFLKRKIDKQRQNKQQELEQLEVSTGKLLREINL